MIPTPGWMRGLVISKAGWTPSAKLCKTQKKKLERSAGKSQIHAYLHLHALHAHIMMYDCAYNIMHKSLSTFVYTQLSEYKECVERALEAKTLPLDVVLECLSTREQRVSIDQVRDEVEGELHKVSLQKCHLDTLQQRFFHCAGVWNN